MSSPTYSNIIYELSTKIEQIATAFSSDGYQTMASWVEKPLGVACLLFIILKGLAITLGFINEPIKDLGRAAIRIGLIYTFAMSWGTFSGYVVDFFVSLSENLGATLMKINVLHFPMPGGVGIKSALQQVLQEVMSVGNWTLAKGSLISPGPIFSGLAIYFTGGAVIGLAFMEIMGAKLFMSILFCIAPLMISLSLFEQTRALFDKWLKGLISFSFVMILVSAVVGFTMALLHWTLSDSYQVHAADMTSVGFIPILLSALFCIKAVKGAADMGHNMGGYCSHGGGEMMAGALGMMGMAKGMKGNLPKGVNAKSIMKGLSKLTPLGSQKAVVAAATKAVNSAKAIRKSMRGE